MPHSPQNNTQTLNRHHRGSASLAPSLPDQLAAYLAVTDDGYWPPAGTPQGGPVSVPYRSTRYPTSNPAQSLVKYLAPNPAKTRNPEIERRAKQASRDPYKWALKTRMKAVYQAWADGDGPQQKYASPRLLKVQMCPGSSVEQAHHGETVIVHEPHFCHELACPYWSAARSENVGRALRFVMDSGLFSEPRLIVLAPPNVPELTNEVVAAMGRVLTKTHRTPSYRTVRGGIETIEIEQQAGRSDWNLHANQLIDSGWIARNPVTDLRYAPASGQVESWRVTSGGGNVTKDSIVTIRSHGGLLRDSRGRVVVDRKHTGLAYDVTKACQSEPLLRASCYHLADRATKLRCDHRPGECVPFDLNNPDHWYFVDVRKADRDAVAEVAKYVTKQSTLLLTGDADRLWTFIQACQGNRMLRVFGSVYKHFKIDARDGRIQLIKTCDAKLPSGRPCNTKNDLHEFTCRNCGSALQLTPAESEILAGDIGDPESEAASLAGEVSPAGDTEGCWKPDCDNPAPVKRRHLGNGSVWALHGPEAWVEKANGHWIVHGVKGDAK